MDEPENHAAARPPKASAVPVAAVPGSGEFLELPLNVIVAQLPSQLREKVRRSPDSADVAKLPLPSILAQLPSGTVKVSFGDLKAALPAGVFVAGPELNASLVLIPLAEILPRLKPTCLKRRPEQKHLRVSSAIASVFASAPGTSDARRFAEPISKPEVIADRDELSASRLMADSTSGMKAPSPATPAAPSVSVPTTSKNIPAASPAKSPSASPNRDLQAIKFALASLVQKWPEALKNEVLADPQSANLEIPLAELEGALGRGRANFKWSQIRQWVTPALASPSAAHDDVMLDLPLPILIPPFMARRSTRTPAKKMAVEGEVPDVFLPRTPNPSPSRKEAPSIPAAAGDQRTVDTEQRPIRSGATVGTTKLPVSPLLSVTPLISMEPPAAAKATASPKEVVQRACRLPGVSGALVATLDGLVVASQFPPELSSEMVAAFLPQIFNRLSQYAHELKMGEPSAVEVTFEKTPLEIFKAGNAYLAALGNAAELPPKSQLSGLAGQLLT